MSLQLSRPSNATRIGLTPLIDVVFILLLFFMLATNFQRWQALDIDSAQSEKSPGSANMQSMLLRLRPNRIDLAGEEIRLTQLGLTLRTLMAETPDAEILVMATEAVPLQQIVEVMDTLRDGEFRQVRFAVQ